MLRNTKVGYTKLSDKFSSLIWPFDEPISAVSRPFDQFDLVPTDCTRKENTAVTIVIYQNYFLNETDVKIEWPHFLQRCWHDFGWRRQNDSPEKLFCYFRTKVSRLCSRTWPWLNLFFRFRLTEKMEAATLTSNLTNISSLGVGLNQTQQSALNTSLLIAEVRFFNPQAAFNRWAPLIKISGKLQIHWTAILGQDFRHQGGLFYCIRNK